MAGFRWKVKLGGHVPPRVGAGPAGGFEPGHRQIDPCFHTPDPVKVGAEVERLRKLGITFDYDKLQGGKAAFEMRRALALRRRRTAIVKKVIEIREAVVKKHGRFPDATLQRAGTWHATMPITELDMPATLARYGRIVPGVLAERRKAYRDPRAPPKVSGFGHVCFIMDGSGSMTRGAGPTYPIDLDAQTVENGPWEPLARGLLMPGHAGLFYRSRPMNPGPASNYMPQYRFRRTDNGQPVPPEEIRRIVDVQTEVCMAVLQEVRTKGHTVSFWMYENHGTRLYGPGRDYDAAEHALLLMDAEGNNQYRHVLQQVAAELRGEIPGGKQMTVFCTDSLYYDVKELLDDPHTKRAMHEIVAAGPVLMMLLNVDVAHDASLQQWIEDMWREYGKENLTINYFPDVTTNDAVFAAARFGVAALGGEVR